MSSKCLAMRRKVQSGRSGDGLTEVIINGQIVDTQNRIGRHTTLLMKMGSSEEKKKATGGRRGRGRKRDGTGESTW